MQKDEIKVFECDSIEEAELLYFKYYQQGWRVHKAIKLVWKFWKFKYVARFEMKKDGHDFSDYMKNVNKALQLGVETFGSIAKIKRNQINNN